MASDNVIIWLVILVSSVVLLCIGERIRLRRARQAFAAGREPLSDEDFPPRASTTEDQATFFLAARAGIAEACGLPSSMLYPEDPIRDLLWLQSDGGDVLDMVFRIERKYGHKVCRCDFPQDATLSEVIHCLDAVRPIPGRP